jgi:hypothetical protein
MEKLTGLAGLSGRTTFSDVLMPSLLTAVDKAVTEELLVSRLEAMGMELVRILSATSLSGLNR